MSRYDPATLHAMGVAPAPRTFQVPRDYVRATRALDQTRVCGGCGAVLWYGQPCPDCKPRKAS